MLRTSRENDRGGGEGSGSDKRAYVLLPPRAFSSTRDFIAARFHGKDQEAALERAHSVNFF